MYNGKIEFQVKEQFNELKALEQKIQQCRQERRARAQLVRTELVPDTEETGLVMKRIALRVSLQDLLLKLKEKDEKDGDVWENKHKANQYFLKNFQKRFQKRFPLAFWNDEKFQEAINAESSDVTGDVDGQEQRDTLLLILASFESVAFNYFHTRFQQYLSDANHDISFLPEEGLFFFETDTLSRFYERFSIYRQESDLPLADLLESVRSKMLTYEDAFPHLITADNIPLIFRPSYRDFIVQSDFLWKLSELSIGIPAISPCFEYVDTAFLDRLVEKYNNDQLECVFSRPYLEAQPNMFQLFRQMFAAGRDNASVSKLEFQGKMIEFIDCIWSQSQAPREESRAKRPAVEGGNEGPASVVNAGMFAAAEPSEGDEAPGPDSHLSEPTP